MQTKFVTDTHNPMETLDTRGSARLVGVLSHTAVVLSLGPTSFPSLRASRTILSPCLFLRALLYFLDG